MSQNRAGVFAADAKRKLEEAGSKTVEISEKAGRKVKELAIDGKDLAKEAFHSVTNKFRRT